MTSGKETMENSGVDARQTSQRAKSHLQNILAAIQRYGLAVLSVSVALGTALLLERYNFRAEFTPFLLAVAVTAWYAGPGPGVVALILSSALFDYFFTEPLYTLYVTGSDVPRFVVFLAFLLLIIWFSAVRRRVEQHLLQSRDELEKK